MLFHFILFYFSSLLLGKFYDAPFDFECWLEVRLGVEKTKNSLSSLSLSVALDRFPIGITTFHQFALLATQFSITISFFCSCHLQIYFTITTWRRCTYVPYPYTFVGGCKAIIKIKSISSLTEWPVTMLWMYTARPLFVSHIYVADILYSRHLLFGLIWNLCPWPLRAFAGSSLTSSRGSWERRPYVLHKQPLKHLIHMGLMLRACVRMFICI